MQDIIVYIIVAGAVYFMGRSWYLAGKGEGGCGGCAKGCASKTAKTEDAPLVQIDLGGWKRD